MENNYHLLKNYCIELEEKGKKLNMINKNVIFIKNFN